MVSYVIMTSQIEMSKGMEDNSNNAPYENNFCWCESIKPLFCFSQLVGNCPLTRNCQNQRFGRCGIQHKFFSPSSLSNLIFIAANSQFALSLYLYGDRLIGSILNGNDGRTYMLEILSVFLQNLAILFFARFNTSSISKVWSIFCELTSPNYLNLLPSRNFRRGTFSLTILLILSTIGFMMCNWKASTNIDCTSTAQRRKDCGEMPVDFNPVATGFSGIIISNCSTLAASLLTYALLIRLLSSKLTKDLAEALNPDAFSPKGSVFENHSRIEHLRKMHLSLQECVVHLREYYGVPCLIVCCGSVIQLSCGLYWLYLFSEGITTSDGAIAYTILFLLQSFYFASLNLGGILVAGQIISDSVSL
jgi:hypothetical protein